MRTEEAKMVLRATLDECMNDARQSIYASLTLERDKRAEMLAALDALPIVRAAICVAIDEAEVF